MSRGERVALQTSPGGGRASAALYRHPPWTFSKRWQASDGAGARNRGGRGREADEATRCGREGQRGASRAERQAHEGAEAAVRDRVGSASVAGRAAAAALRMQLRAWATLASAEVARPEGGMVGPFPPRDPSLLSPEVDREGHKATGRDAAEHVLARLACAGEDDEELLLPRGRKPPQPAHRQLCRSVRAGGLFDRSELVERDRGRVEEGALNGLPLAGDLEANGDRRCRARDDCGTDRA